MADSAILKLDRASERIAELDELLRKARPFRYILATNTETGERTIAAKQNEAVIERAAIISGDAAHNIRTALDHAYWEIVSPFATTPREEKNIQFPFSATKGRLEEGVKSRLAHKVSDKFFRAMVGLAPHGQGGGNRLLYLIDQLDAPDKHRRLTPMADYKRISGRTMKALVPDLPLDVEQYEIAGNALGDFRWRTSRIDANTLGTPIIPTMYLFEKELDVPVEIIFRVGPDDPFVPAVPTLHQLVDVARKTIGIMRRAAS